MAIEDFDRKPTNKNPVTDMGKNFEKKYTDNMRKENVPPSYLEETDNLLNEKEQSLKKKIFQLDKMEALVHSDNQLSAVYNEMAEDGDEKYGYHYNETIMNLIFNEYVLNSQKFLYKYKMAVPKEKKRRDKSGINQLQKAGQLDQKRQELRKQTPHVEAEGEIHNNSLPGAIEELDDNTSGNFGIMHGVGGFDVDRDGTNRTELSFDTMKEPIKEADNNEFLEITTPIGSADDQLFIEVVNQGIDSHLEGFTQSKFEVADQGNGKRRILNFHTSEIPVLIRRLEDMGSEEATSWSDKIKAKTGKEIEENKYTQRNSAMYNKLGGTGSPYPDRDQPEMDRDAVNVLQQQFSDTPARKANKAAINDPDPLNVNEDEGGTVEEKIDIILNKAGDQYTFEQLLNLDDTQIEEIYQSIGSQGVAPNEPEIGETTGAASSGAFTGPMGTNPKKFVGEAGSQERNWEKDELDTNTLRQQQKFYGDTETPIHKLNKQAIEDPNPLDLGEADKEPQGREWEKDNLDKTYVRQQEKNFGDPSTSIYQKNKAAIEDPNPLDLGEGKEEEDVIDETTTSASSGQYTGPFGKKRNKKLNQPAWEGGEIIGESNYLTDPTGFKKFINEMDDSLVPTMAEDGSYSEFLTKMDPEMLGRIFTDLMTNIQQNPLAAKEDAKPKFEMVKNYIDMLPDEKKAELPDVVQQALNNKPWWSKLLNFFGLSEAAETPQDQQTLQGLAGDLAQDGVEIDVNEKAESKSQQRFMGMVHAYKKGELPDASDEIKKAAGSMTDKDAEDFASTKHKGLPEKVPTDEGQINEYSGEAVEYISDRSGEEPFELQGEKWQFVNAKYPDGKTDIGVYKFGEDLTFDYAWWRQHVGIDPVQEGTGDVDEGIDSDAQTKTSDFIKNFKGEFNDDDIHAFAETNGLNVHEVEAYIYSLARKGLNTPKRNDEGAGETLGKIGGAIAGGAITKTPAGAMTGSKIGGAIGKQFEEAPPITPQAHPEADASKFAGEIESILEPSGLSYDELDQEEQQEILDIIGVGSEEETMGMGESIIDQPPLEGRDGTTMAMKSDASGMGGSPTISSIGGADMGMDLGEDSGQYGQDTYPFATSASDKVKKDQVSKGYGDVDFGADNYAQTKQDQFSESVNESAEVDENVATRTKCKRDEEPVAGTPINQPGGCKKKNVGTPEDRQKNPHNIASRKKRLAKQEKEHEAKKGEYQKELEKNKKQMDMKKAQVSEDKKPSSLVMKDRLGKENQANFKKDMADSPISDVIDLQDELMAKDQVEEVPSNPYELGEKIEKEHLATNDGKAFKDVGNSTNDKGDEIPKRNLANPEQKEVDMITQRQSDWVFDNKPSDRFEERMEKDMGEEIYQQRQDKMEYRADAPMYNKDTEPIEDGEVKKDQFDKYSSKWNERDGTKKNKLKKIDDLMESMMTGKFTDMFGKTRFINFKMDETVEGKAEGTKLNLDGMGNGYTTRVNENAEMRNMMEMFDFYINGDKVTRVKSTKTGKQSLTEGKEEKPIVNEQAEKMKRLMGYDPSKHMSTANVKKNRNF